MSRVIKFSSTISAQEPGKNASEIFASLKHVRPGNGFVPNFELFAKTEVSIYLIYWDILCKLIPL